VAAGAAEGIAEARAATPVHAHAAVAAPELLQHVAVGGQGQDVGAEEVGGVPAPDADDGEQTLRRGCRGRPDDGLTVIALGTASPELVTTLTSTVRGDRDIAVGNLLGSSVYNIAVVLGITVMPAPAEVQIPDEVVAADLLVLAVVGLITVPVLLSGQRISRLEGGAFVAAYLGYLVWLILF
jgi:Sodium/calcium exchanger protein